jgi:hypothetical protein
MPRKALSPPRTAANASRVVNHAVMARIAVTALTGAIAANEVIAVACAGGIGGPGVAMAEGVMIRGATKRAHAATAIAMKAGGMSRAAMSIDARMCRARHQWRERQEPASRRQWPRTHRRAQSPPCAPRVSVRAADAHVAAGVAVVVAAPDVSRAAAADR